MEGPRGGWRGRRATVQQIFNSQPQAEHRARERLSGRGLHAVFGNIDTHHALLELKGGIPRQQRVTNRTAKHKELS